MSFPVPQTVEDIVDKVKFKRNRVLRRIRREGRVGRLALARELRISNSRVCDLIQQLLDEGLLNEEAAGNERRGRRGVPVMLNGGYGHMVGFDMEARRMRLVIVNFKGETVWQTHRKLAPIRSRQAFIDTVIRFIESGLEKASGQFKNLLGIGLAVSGLVDVHRGVIMRDCLIQAADNVPIRDLVADRFGLPCVIDDNIRAMTLAEWQHGAGRQLNSFICLAIRTGVSAGIVINGKIHTGSHGFAGEVGYAPVPSGPTAANWKSFRNLVSEEALGIDPEAEQIELTQSRARKAGELLGAHAATLASVLDPEAIVLAGGLVQPDGPLWNHAERSFRRLVLPELAERVPLVPARLGPYAAAVGATHRCFETLYPVEPAGK